MRGKCFLLFSNFIVHIVLCQTMLGLNKSQLKNGIILAMLFFLTSQVFKEYKSAVDDELIFTKWAKL